MKFSHISDTHLGLVQYGLEEREQDIYDSFNQAIDISINDKVDFVIFAGDVFHTPTPSGTAILQMANALKRLKQNLTEVFPTSVGLVMEKISFLLMRQKAIQN